MDQSRVKAIVEAHMEGLARLLRVGHWKISVTFDGIEGRGGAECFIDIHYETARIAYDCRKYDTEEEVLASLYHELCHVVGSPFDLVEMIAADVIGDDKSGQSALKRAGTYANEQFVLNMERIWAESLRDVYLERHTRPT